VTVAVVVLDSGVVGAFADADRLLRERVARLARRSGEPFLVPATVIIEATTGSPARDAKVNRFLRGCEIVALGEALARRSAALRSASRRGSPVDASVVATAEARGGGVVLSTDLDDLRALAAHAVGVEVLGLSNASAPVE
jgi:predicted nucleic acid-binding protein